MSPANGSATNAEPSPAERFAQSRRQREHALVQAFREQLRFEMDPFQIAACQSLEAGRSVLVAAPTGAGKTVVAEFAIYRALSQRGAKVFYTTPMKALSNQKFQELVDAHGASNVGLLTGDSSINPHARVIVMTTEVLRNMLYAGSDLLVGLETVVMDEVHYLADRARGAVWEEVIIHLDPSVQMVSLSATVSNAEEFGDWLQAVRGHTDVVVSEDRPVPLYQHVATDHLIPLFDPSKPSQVNPELVVAVRGSSGGGGGRNSRGRARRGARSYGRPAARINRETLVRLLSEHSLLPAIVFVFSRIGCEQAAKQVSSADLNLTTPAERAEIRAFAEERCAVLPEEDLAVLGYWGWIDGLQRGIASHHAGLLPVFKEVVEELFRRKLLKVVFATETLALGINMPARTVVIEKLQKFNGESRVPITAGEYTQLTGRAGRRGIDIEGHSVVIWQDGLDAHAVASLASRRTYPLNSSFRPTYNMAVNLIASFGVTRARRVLESSFAQFQADRAVVGLAKKVRDIEGSLAGYAESMECHLGDFTDYSRVRRELTEAERRKVADPRSKAQQQSRQQEIARLRSELKRHPAHACPDRESHARWAERYWRLDREARELRRQIASRTGAVAATFDRITALLTELGYVKTGDDGTESEASITVHGRMLSRIYGERDLLIAESLRRNYWKDLDAPALAAMATCLVYEPRLADAPDAAPRLPSAEFAAAFDATTSRWAVLSDKEEEFRLPGSSTPSAALAMAMYRWARGASLVGVLRETDLAAGDFVRVSRQTIDALDQISEVAPGGVGRTARRAIDLVRRGIVAASEFG